MPGITLLRAETRPAASPRYVTRFSDLTLDDLPRVGGKNASLGELVRSLGAQGIRVPAGFALTADAFRLHLQAPGSTSRSTPSSTGSISRT